MLRRAAAALVTALLLASCGSTNDAATVNDGAVTVASLEQVVADFATVGETQILNGVASGDTVRGLLTSLIRAEVVNQVLAANDVEVTQAERDEVAAQLASQGNTDLPPTLIELIITLNSANAALARVAPLSTTDIAANYDIDPKKLGVLCVRHLVVEDEATAKRSEEHTSELQSH